MAVAIWGSIARCRVRQNFFQLRCRRGDGLTPLWRPKSFTVEVLKAPNNKCHEGFFLTSDLFTEKSGDLMKSVVCYETESGETCVMDSERASADHHIEPTNLVVMETIRKG